MYESYLCIGHILSLVRLSKRNRRYCNKTLVENKKNTKWLRMSKNAVTIRTGNYRVRV